VLLLPISDDQALYRWDGAHYLCHSLYEVALAFFGAQAADYCDDWPILVQSEVAADLPCIY
jgi:hypothetical protein